MKKKKMFLKFENLKIFVNFKKKIENFIGLLLEEIS